MSVSDHFRSQIKQIRDLGYTQTREEELVQMLLKYNGDVNLCMAHLISTQINQPAAN
jgi:hypothetical protein